MSTTRVTCLINGVPVAFDIDSHIGNMQSILPCPTSTTVSAPVRVTATWSSAKGGATVTLPKGRTYRTRYGAAMAAKGGVMRRKRRGRR